MRTNGDDMNTKAKETALDAFIGTKADIDDLIARLQAASDDHFGRNPDSVNWGDVGSLGHAAKQLEEIARVLNV
jgi:hypothetical protein